jgi:hypothetical protein
MATYMGEMRHVLATIFNATLGSGNGDDWHEVHELRYLFRGNTEWTTAHVHTLADVAWDTLGFG